MSKFEIRKIDGYTRSNRTGAPLVRKPIWQIVVDGVVRESAPTRKEAERRIRVWN